jgi:hypothetical protein
MHTYIYWIIYWINAYCELERITFPNLIAQVPNISTTRLEITNYKTRIISMFEDLAGCWSKNYR